MISIRGKFWFNILRLFRWRLGSLLKVTQEKKQKNKLEFWRKAKNFNISDISFNDFKVIKFIPKNNIEGNFIIYLHGGGYVACGPETHASIVTQLSSYSRTTVLFPVYRLAPKFPFPSAIDDCLIVYKDLLEKGVEAKNISLVGDSAGGGLVMALLQILSKEKIDFPSSAILISPWTDLTLSGESMKERAGRDPMLHPGKEMDDVVRLSDLNIDATKYDVHNLHAEDAIVVASKPAKAEDLDAPIETPDLPEGAEEKVVEKKEA